MPPPATEVYRPLSLLALAGFIVSLLYCILVVICAAVSLFGSPLLLPAWTLIFPLGASGLALAGWFSIHASEETKAGKALAVWAISLCVVFGLGNWAYYAATYFTIRQQADQCARQWFEKIQEGNLESAYRLTLVPEERPREGPDLRRDIELRFNSDARSAKSSGPDSFTRFKQKELIRVMRQSGQDIEIKPMGVSSWEPVRFGYKVTQTYRLVTPQATIEIKVTAQSSEGRRQQFDSRQWFIVARESGIVKDSGKATELGQKMMALQGESGAFLAQWMESLRGSRMEEAYLATRAPEKRARLRKQARQCLQLESGFTWGLCGRDVLTTVCTAACLPTALDDRLPDYDDFGRGQLVRIDENNFWAPEDAVRDTALAETKKLFQRQGALPAGVLHAEPGAMLYWKRVGDRIQIEHEVVVRLRGLAATVDAVVMVECDANVLDSTPPFDFRVTALELRGVRVGGPNQPPGAPGMSPDPRGGPPALEGLPPAGNPP
jgi:hypothetical protein